MRDTEKPRKKSTAYDFFAKIAGNLRLNELPKHERFNLVSSAIIAIVALALAIPPFLALVTNMIIAVGNIFIISSGKAEYAQEINTSIFGTIIIPLLIVVVESIICKIYCFVVAKMNKPHDGD